MKKPKYSIKSQVLNRIPIYIVKKKIIWGLFKINIGIYRSKDAAKEAIDLQKMKDRLRGFSITI